MRSKEKTISILTDAILDSLQNRYKKPYAEVSVNETIDFFLDDIGLVEDAQRLQYNHKGECDGGCFDWFFGEPISGKPYEEIQKIFHDEIIGSGLTDHRELIAWSLERFDLLDSAEYERWSGIYQEYHYLLEEYDADEEEEDKAYADPYDYDDGDAAYDAWKEWDL